MNCLTEALGLALPGNGSTLATRRELFGRAGTTVMERARRWYAEDDESALPRSIATRSAGSSGVAVHMGHSVRVAGRSGGPSGWCATATRS